MNSDFLSMVLLDLLYVVLFDVSFGFGFPG